MIGEEERRSARTPIGTGSAILKRCLAALMSQLGLASASTAAPGSRSAAVKRQPEAQLALGRVVSSRPRLKAGREQGDGAVPAAGHALELAASSAMPVAKR